MLKSPSTSLIVRGILDLADDLGREYRHPAVVLVSNNPQRG